MVIELVSAISWMNWKTIIKLTNKFIFIIQCLTIVLERINSISKIAFRYERFDIRTCLRNTLNSYVREPLHFDISKTSPVLVNSALFKQWFTIPYTYLAFISTSVHLQTAIACSVYEFCVNKPRNTSVREYVCTLLNQCAVVTANYHFEHAIECLLFRKPGVHYANEPR